MELLVLQTLYMIYSFVVCHTIHYYTFYTHARTPTYTALSFCLAHTIAHRLTHTLFHLLLPTLSCCALYAISSDVDRARRMKTLPIASALAREHAARFALAPPALLFACWWIQLI